MDSQDLATGILLVVIYKDSRWKADWRFICLSLCVPPRRPASLVKELPHQESRQQKLSAELQLNVLKTDFQWKILVGRMSVSTINRLPQKFQTKVDCGCLVLCTLYFWTSPLHLGHFSFFDWDNLDDPVRENYKIEFIEFPSCIYKVESCIALYCIWNSEFTKLEIIYAHIQV